MATMATDGDGPCNTGSKARPEAKGWFMTWNNHNLDEVRMMATMATDLCTKYRMQEEVGKEGTKHIQGTFEFKKKLRLSTLKKLFSDKIHWEITKNSVAAAAYCSKQETSTGLSWTKGYPKPVKILEYEQLKDWQLEIDAIIQQEPDDRKIYWYWGPTNIGKTTFCKYLSVKYGAIPLGGKGADMRNGIVEYRKTNGELPTKIIIPLPKTFNLDYISYDGIETVKDMYFYSGKYEGGCVVGNCPHIFIFANEPPETSKLAQDRWVIREIN